MNESGMEHVSANGHENQEQDVLGYELLNLCFFSPVVREEYLPGATRAEIRSLVQRYYPDEIAPSMAHLGRVGGH